MHGSLLFYAVLAFSLISNTCFARLPQIENLILLFHILGSLDIIISLVYLAPHQLAREAFTDFLNLGNWSIKALSFFFGLISATSPFPSTLEACTYHLLC